MKKLFILTVILVEILLFLPCPMKAQDSKEAEFVSWASRSMVKLKDLDPGDDPANIAALQRMVGSARIVATSEEGHAGAEPLIFRNNLLKVLVEKMGFTGIAIESGVTEGRVIHDYVLGGPGDLKSTLKQGLSWTFDQLPQNEALVRWMREYNADPKHKQKVNFYGFDIPGSPGNPEANRGPDTALRAALEYLDKVDSTTAAAIRARAESLLPFLNFSLYEKSKTEHQYTELPSVDRDKLTALINDLISLFEIRSQKYIAASSAEEYQWNYRYALCARQMDEWLRKVPVSESPLKAPSEADAKLPLWMWESHEIRNRAQAENIKWVLRQEGPSGRILVFVSRFHVATSPLSEARFGADQPYHPEGWFLKQEFGSQLVTIGNFLGHGSIGCGDLHVDFVAAPNSFNSLLVELNTPIFLLDLRRAPPGIQTWLSQPHDQYLLDWKLTGPIAGTFDVILFTEKSSDACPRLKQ